MWPAWHANTIFSDTSSYRRSSRCRMRAGVSMPRIRSKAEKELTKRKAADDVARMRAEAGAAIAEARKSHDRLREAIDILPQGIVFLDGEGRYILWNKKYAEIYSRSADLFEPGARLADTIRVGVARGDYPEAVVQHLLMALAGLAEPVLADGRVVLIEERRTGDGGVI